MRAGRTFQQDDVISITDTDLHLFHEGTHYRLFEKFGAHLRDRNEVHFAVWAPNAERVSVAADFNNWNPDAHLLTRGPSGIWSGTVPKVREAALYRYHVIPQGNGRPLDKTDPFGFFHKVPPEICSQVWDLRYEWHDEGWMRLRGQRARLDHPLSIYEVHLGSWMRVPE